MQADLIHSCLHRVMAVLPEPEEGDSPQEVSVAPTVGGGPPGGISDPCGGRWGTAPRSYQRPPRWPCPGVGAHSRTGSFSCSSSCTWTPCRSSRTC